MKRLTLAHSLTKQCCRSFNDFEEYNARLVLNAPSTVELGKLGAKDSSYGLKGSNELRCGHYTYMSLMVGKEERMLRYC